MMGDNTSSSGSSKHSAKDRLRKLYPFIHNFSTVQVKTFGAQFVQEGIITPEELKDCDKGLQLADHLWGRTENQINLALRIFAQDRVTRIENDTEPPTPPEQFSSAQLNPTSPLLQSHSCSEQLENGSNNCLEQQERTNLLQQGYPSVSNGTQINTLFNKRRDRTKWIKMALSFISVTLCITLIIQLARTGSSLAGPSPTPLSPGESILDIPAPIALIPNGTSPTAKNDTGTGELVTIRGRVNDEGESSQKSQHGEMWMKDLGESSANSTSIYTTINNIQDKELMRLKKSFAHDPIPLLSVDAVETIQLFKPFICNKTVKKALELEINTPFDTLQFQMPCIGSLNGLVVSGNATIQNLHQIIRDSLNIEFLSIDAHEICITADDHWGGVTEDIERLEKIVLPKLKYLKISNFSSECSDLVQFLDETLLSPNVETLVLENFNLEVLNLDWIENTISTKYSKLDTFSFTGKLCPTCELFQRRVFNKSIKALRFTVNENHFHNNFQNYQNKIGLASVKNLIENSSETLQYFESNVALPRNRILFRHFNTVRVMDMMISLPESVFQLSASFLSFFPNISELTVRLQFSNRNVCKSLNVNDTVKITNLKKYMESTHIWKLVIKASCRLDAVKGWQLYCRDYSFEKLDNDYVVILSATKYSSECSRFWNSSM